MAFQSFFFLDFLGFSKTLEFCRSPSIFIQNGNRCDDGSGSAHGIRVFDADHRLRSEEIILCSFQPSCSLWDKKRLDFYFQFFHRNVFVFYPSGNILEEFQFFSENLACFVEQSLLEEGWETKIRKRSSFPSLFFFRILSANSWKSLLPSVMIL